MKPTRLPLTRVALAIALAACGAQESEELADAGAGPDSDSPFARQFVAAHDQVRASVEPAPQPALPPLQWNAEAARVAQAWADRCDYRHNPNNGQLGENLAAAAPPSDEPPSWAVELWASEAADYDYATNSCAPNQVCGHYTQLVWRDTTSVGCATRICSTGSPFGGSFPTWQLWVCNYDPPGNWVGERPY